MEIKGLEKLGIDEAGAADLATVKAETQARINRLLAIGVVFLRVILARGGNVPGRKVPGGRAKRRKAVALARKANRSRRG